MSKKSEEQTNEGAQEANEATEATVTTTIANIDIALPVRFVAGHVLSEVEAKVIDAAYRRQFKNNQDAAYKAWEGKCTTAIAKGEAEPANPCTAEKLLELFVTYHPQVGSDGASALEKAKQEAGLRALIELIDEHNVEHKATGKGPLGAAPFKLPAGKGSADAKAALVAKVLASPKQASRVQRHLDAVLAERKAKPEDTGAATITADIEF